MLSEISIIIPVYNVEKYLERCLDSVINQKDVIKEIIIVNDGSTDNSLNIIKKYKYEFNEFIIINKENGGLSEARNVGLRYANSKYVCFIDSDDFIENEMLREMLDIAYKEDSDIVITDFYIYIESNKKKSVYNSRAPYNMNRNETIKALLLGDLKAYAWNKIYKRNLFTKNNIYYPNGKYYEDIPTTIKLFNQSSKINYLQKPLYYYVQREDSITRVPRIQYIYDIISNLEIVKQIAGENLIKEFEAFHVENLAMAATIYNECSFCSRYNKEELLSVKFIINAEMKNINISLLDNNIHIKTKIKYILLKCNLYRIAIIFNHVKKINFKLFNFFRKI